MSRSQDTWLEASLRGLDNELGGAIGPLSDRDIATAKAMVLATLRKTIGADPAGFRKSLDANAEAAATMMGSDNSGSTGNTGSAGGESPIRSLRKSLASGKAGAKPGAKANTKESAASAATDF